MASNTDFTMTGGTIETASGSGIDAQASSTATITITGGTIKGASHGIFTNDTFRGTINIGSETSTINSDNPVIQGKTYGISRSGGTWNFYNGVIKGGTAAYNVAPTAIRNKCEVKQGQETINNTTYKTACLEILLRFTEAYLNSGSTTILNGATISVTTNNSVNGNTYPGLSITGRPTRSWTDPLTPSTMIRWYKSINFDGFNYLEFYVKKGENHGSCRVFIDETSLYTSMYQSLSTDWTKVTLDVSEYTGNHTLSLIGGYTDYSGNATSNTLYCDIRLKQ